MATTLTDDTTAGMPLRDLVSVRPRYLRSVNLERDFYTGDPLVGYVVTPSVLSSLERIATAIEQPYARAISLTGAYGSGKSAFALFVATMLSNPDKAEGAPLGRITHLDPSLAKRLHQENGSYWPVLVTGTRAPLGRALVQGLLTALERQVDPAAKAVARSVRRAASTLGDLPSAREVVTVFEHASQLARQKSASCRGIVTVIDEAGKYLEYAAFHPARGDMQVLQELAEFAARSGDAPFLMMTVLHQAFDDYAHRLSAQQRAEWQKVHGRFVDVPFGDTPEEAMRLVAQAVDQQDATDMSVALDRHVDQQLQWCEDLRLFPPFLSAGEYKDVLRRTYPLHPLTLRLIPYVFRRFGQSERSLFSFLSSEEPYGFQEFLRSNHVSAEHVPQLRVDHLYDYVVNALGSSLYAHHTGKLWSEAEEALFRLRDREPVFSRLVKTIGILHILGEQTRILPSKEVLVFALADESVTRSTIEQAIDQLEASTVITFRQFRKAYRLYEGSDVDIEARLREAHVHFAYGTDSIAVAERLETVAPVVARRHSFETGTLRSFRVTYCRPSALAAEIDQPGGDVDGQLLVCLASDTSELAGLADSVCPLLNQRTDVIVGLSVESDALHEAAVAVESLVWVKENTPELRNDRVATREIDERLVEARSTFLAEWERILRPNLETGVNTAWRWRGQRLEVQSYRQLQEAISDACDSTYGSAPRVRNELINRRQLTSVAAAARRSLIEAMLTKAEVPLLGIEGYPPERSMYASLLASTGIHRKGQDGTWAILPPQPEADYGFLTVWLAMEEWLFGGDLRPKPLASLYELLCAPPFGVTNGIVPVLLCAVFIYRQHEIGIYEEGRFVTDLDIATFERLIKRPEDYALQGCRVAGERSAVLARFGRGLVGDDDATIITVVRRLYQAFRGLPDYVSRTRNLSEQARALRDALKSSTEPEQLLFVDLPHCLGAEPFAVNEAGGDNVDLFFSRWNTTYSELVNAYPRLLDRIEATLLRAFEVDSWTGLRHRAAVILPYISAQSLSSFALRAADETLDRDAWLTSVSSVVVHRPPTNWNDVDEQVFTQGIEALAPTFATTLSLAIAKKQQLGDADRFAMRIAVATETGDEDAAVVLAPRAQGQQVDELARSLVETIRERVRPAPREIQLAAIAKALQELLRRGNEEDTP